ncbi:Uncharacterized protein XB16_0907 [Leptospira santarosai]|uniref:Uncharacterized protein n=1 Tax=Leptospira santarosai TaxID=28183 RepID=A0A2P1QQQ6_9LEPT|nr:Uncharacterized protein XB16_0907 [Leptospira santarosai]
MNKLVSQYFGFKSIFHIANGIFLSLFLCCSQTSKVVKIDFPSTDQELISFLTSIEKWENDSGRFIEFHKDNTFLFVQENEPVITGIGKFELKEKQIKLNFNKQGNHTWLNGKKYVCNFVLKRHAWKPQQCISCIEERKDDKFELSNSNSVNSGNEDSIDNVKVKILGFKLTITKRSVYIRESPTITGKIIPLSNLGSEECLDEGYLFRTTEKPEKVNPDIYIRFPKNFDLILIAKTQEKYNVEQYENYWYYAKISVPCIGYVTTKYGWVYGEFIN